MKRKSARFRLGGRDVAAEPYRYRASGLDDVYLLSGFERHKTEYGEGVSVANAKELHKTIGLSLILNYKALSPKEIRFLRKEMELTQDELGQCLGVAGQTVARYEKGETDPGPADKLVRLVFAFYLMPEKERAKVFGRGDEGAKASSGIG